MDISRIAFNTCFASVALVLATWGALQCFWPEKLRALRDRLPRGYNSDGPLGRVMARLRDKESGLLSRISGLFLFFVMVSLLGWWFLGHPALGR